jgi:hypothetical protein
MFTKTLAATAILAPVILVALAVALTDLIGRQKMIKTILAAAAASLLAIALAAPAQAGIKGNGLLENGLARNGAELNGSLANGLARNGLARNGIERAAPAFVIDGIELPASAR